MKAGLKISVRSNLREVVTRLSLEGPKAIDRATVTALNRAMPVVRTEAVRGIRERYNIKAAAARKQMRISKAGRGRLFAELVVSGRNIALYEFSARQTKKGVTVRVTQQRKLVRSAFIATMKSGRTGVFTRLGMDRLPIKELFSVSLPKAFTQRQILAALRVKAAEQFTKEFERAVKFRGRGNNG